MSWRGYKRYLTIKEYQPFVGILPNDPQHRPTLSEVVGARYFITGSYFLKGGNLYIDTHLLDAYTQESVYHLPVMEGPKDSVMQVIEAVRLKIAGLVTNLEEVKLGKLNPPNYEAYKYYLAGLQELKVGTYPLQALLNFEKATALEPQFVMPQTFLTWFYRGAKRDSIVRLIAEVPTMTAYERKVYLETYHLFHRDYQEALRVDLQTLDEYPQDYFFNMWAGHQAKCQFFPTLALQVLSQMKDPLLGDFGLVWHYYKVRNYSESLMMLGRYEEARVYLESIPAEFYNWAIPDLLINVYVNLGKSREEIEAFVEQSNRREGKSTPKFYMSAAYEFRLTSDLETSAYFARKAFALFEQSSPTTGVGFDEVDALYLTNDLIATRAYVRKKLAEEGNSDDRLIYLALIEARLGHATEAERIFARLGDRSLIYWRRHEFEYDADYLKARIYALLGQKDTAVALLQRALDKGQLCHYYDFHRDIFLQSLFDYPSFQVLVQPREYPEITVASQE